MGIGTGHCCVDCNTYFVPSKNSVFVLETHEDGTDYKIWMADLLICPLCNHRLLSGFGGQAMAEHYELNFKETKQKCIDAGMLFTINGCPHAPVRWNGRTN